MLQLAAIPQAPFGSCPAAEDGRCIGEPGARELAPSALGAGLAADETLDAAGWHLDRRFEGGSFGQVWRAARRGDDGQGVHPYLSRIGMQCAAERATGSPKR